MSHLPDNHLFHKHELIVCHTKVTEKHRLGTENLKKENRRNAIRCHLVKKKEKEFWLR